MNELVILSGKGGTDKTSVTAMLAVLHRIGEGLGL
jgi:MinD superfamily P-loop ATPase